MLDAITTRQRSLDIRVRVIGFVDEGDVYADAVEDLLGTFSYLET